MPDSSLTLRADSVLIPGGLWWLVRRLPDHAHPFVWRREPILCFTLARDDERRVRLVPVLHDCAVTPLRPAVLERDGADFLQRGDALHPCECTERIIERRDPRWCCCCCGEVER